MVVGSSVEWRFGPVFGGRAVLIDGCGYGKVVAACHVTRGWLPLFVGGLGDGGGSLGLVTALRSLLSGTYAAYFVAPLCKTQGRGLAS